MRAIIRVVQSNLVLHFPTDIDGVPFIVGTDVSQSGIGAAIWQVVEGKTHYITYYFLALLSQRSSAQLFSYQAQTTGSGFHLHGKTTASVWDLF